MHVGEQLTGTAYAGLHFVEDQQRVVLVAQLAGTLQVSNVCRDHTALALDRLDDHGAGLVGDLRLECFQIVVRHMADAGDFRAETVGVLRLTADTHGEQGTTVEAVNSGDDFVLFRAETVMGDTTGQLEGGFVGFGAGVAEEGALSEGRVDQLVGQTQGRFVSEHVGHVPQLVGLLGQRANQRRVCMAQHVYGNPAREVDQLAARLIPDSGARTTNGDKGRRCVIGNHYLVEIGALHRSLLNGHRSLLKRNACLKLASDGGIVRTDRRPALSPSDNFL
ncbi:hypothetical protein D3C84_661500 [compost metagenome]